VNAGRQARRTGSLAGCVSRNRFAAVDGPRGVGGRIVSASEKVGQESRPTNGRASASATSTAPAAHAKPVDPAREAITYYHPMDDREADRAPLSGALIRRIYTYTGPHAARRNWLFVLTFVRGLQLPALAWMIGQTLNGPIAGQDLRGI